MMVPDSGLFFGATL